MGITTHSSIVVLPGNPMDRGAWRASVHRVSKSWTGVKRLSTHTHMELRKNTGTYSILDSSKGLGLSGWRDIWPFSLQHSEFSRKLLKGCIISLLKAAVNKIENDS